MTTEIVEYTETEKGLAELRQKYAAVVFDVTSGKGMTEAKAARAELRTLRTDLEKKRVEIKAPALKRCREIESEAQRITAELAALEDPIDASIKAEEGRKAAEKAEREKAERERVEALHARFTAIKTLPLGAVNATVERIDEIIGEAEAIDPATFPEDMQAAAKFERSIAIASLRAARDARVAQDREEARIKADLEELERLRAQQAAQQAEADRLAAAERERHAAEARRVEEQARAEREAAENAARAAREAEQARIDAERAEARRKEDAERAEAAEKLRREQAEAAAERMRLTVEKAAAEQAARDSAIASATLLSAAVEAYDFLRAKGFGGEIVTQKLAAAIRRDAPEQVAA